MEKINKNSSSKLKKFFLNSAIFVGALFLLFPNLSFGADLKIGANYSTYQVGDNVSVRVSVASPGQAINAVSGTLKFPADKLQVVSLSKASSVVNLWVQEPAFSNTTGEVNFEGAILNPGFVGASGLALTINFKAKKEGTVNLNYSVGSILANDGQGTNVLGKLGQLNLTIKPATAVPTVPVSPTPKPNSADLTPLAVISTTHTDETKWYNNSLPEFSWVVPTGVTALNLSLDQKDNTDPAEQVAGNTSSYKAPNALTDGEWYFHIKYKVGGNWSPITHRKLQIDTGVPEKLNINEIKQTEIGKASFAYDGSDQASGIDRFEFQVDGASPANLNETSGIYNTLSLADGAHTLLVKVFDRAGNVATKKIDFQIGGAVSPSLSASLGTWPLVIIIVAGILSLILVVILAMLLIISWRRLDAIESFSRKEHEESTEHLRQAISLVESSLRSRQESSSAPVVSVPVVHIPTPLPPVEPPAPTSELTTIIKNENNDRGSIVFRGQGNPGEAIVVLRDEKMLAETAVGPDGHFEVGLSGLIPGYYRLSVTTVENLNKRSLHQVYPVLLSAGTTSLISGLVMKNLPN